MRAILINPKEQTITEVECTGELDNMQSYVGGYIELVRIDSRNDLYVDEEGMFKPEQGMFRFDGDNPAYLVGNGIITGASGSVVADATLTLDEVRARVAFGGPVKIGAAMIFAEFNLAGDGSGRYWNIER